MAISSSTSSTSSAVSAFNIDGVSSGLKTADIIDKLISLQKGSLNQLTNQQSKAQARDDAYQLIDAQMLSLQTALNKLRIPSNVNAKAVTSGTATVATATANSSAVNGSYALNVTRLATATSVTGSILSNGAWISAPVGGGFKDGTEPGAPVVLADAGFSTRPTAGSFTVNGIKISIDPATQSLHDVISAINGSAANVTASVGTDANGNKNFITLHSTSTPPQAIQLGSGSDTSNFLTAARLVSTGDVGDITSAVPLGAVGTSTTLSGLNLSHALTASSGSFSINGKQISWDAATDSLSTILGKINSAGAGVNAIYDPNTDAVSLTNVATGSQSIDLDPSQDRGGLLAALHLDGGAAQQRTGQTAQFTINGGPPQYSNSNTLSNVVAGVTVNIASTGSTSLSVAQDPQTTITNVQSFVTAYNTLVDSIDKYTRYDMNTKTAALLTGDSGLQTLQSQLRRMLTGSVPGLQGQYNSLGSIGISTGTFGSIVGTTNHLSVDTDKLTDALKKDSAAVLAVLVGDRRTTLNPGPNGTPQPGAWVTSVSGTPTDPTHGRYQVTIDPSGTLKAVFTPVAGAAQSPIAGTISAFSSNTSLIPGMSISVGALPTSGSLTDSITVGQTGILSGLSDYVSTSLGKGGLFDTQHTTATSALKALADKITAANSQIALKQQTLQSQFTAMEVALTKLQSQGSQLTSTVNGWQGKSG